MQDGLPTLRSYYGQWTKYVGGKYMNIDKESFRGSLYQFLENKMVKAQSQNGDVKVVAYHADKRKINDIIDALSAWCPVLNDAPTWLVDTGLPDPKNLISFKNGLLDVDEYVNGNIVMYESTPALFNYNMLPYDFDPDAESQVWEDFLDDVFNGCQDQKDLLGEWFGYNCIPDISMEKLMFMLGPPRSGKGTILNALIGTLGGEQCASMSFNDLSSTYGYSPMMGKLAVFFPDVKGQNRSRLGNAFERILHVVGADPVGVQRKYLSFLPQVTLACKFTMAMNDIPDLPDDNNALEPRLVMLNFENTYVGREDFTLKSRIQEAALRGELINFALRGLKRLREKKMFTTPASSVLAMRRTVGITSPIKAFVADLCDMAPPGCSKNYTDSIDVLFEAWTNWCDSNNLKSANRVHFSRQLQQACPGSNVVRMQQDGRRYRFMTGLKLCDWVKEKYAL